MQVHLTNTRIDTCTVDSDLYVSWFLKQYSLTYFVSVFSLLLFDLVLLYYNTIIYAKK